MQIISYKNGLFESINDNLREALRSFSSDSIHDLRVTLKRFRSLYFILAELDDRIEKRELESKVQRLFKSAGRMRDLQVGQEIVRNCAVNSLSEAGEYYNFLRDRETVVRQGFQRVVKEFKTKSLKGISNKIDQVINGVQPDELEKSIGRNAVAALLRLASRKNSKQLASEELHSLRMDAKDARYRIQVLTMVNQSKETFGEIDKWLRGLHQSIGRWHDMVIADNNLHNFMSKDAIAPLCSPGSYDDMSNVLKERAGEYHRQIMNIWTDQEGVLKKSVDCLLIYNI